jgi:hypothetical protein
MVYVSTIIQVTFSLLSLLSFSALCSYTSFPPKDKFSHHYVTKCAVIGLFYSSHIQIGHGKIKVILHSLMNKIETLYFPSRAVSICDVICYQKKKRVKADLKKLH